MGQSAVVLSWEVQNATTVLISSIGRVPLAGSLKVSPTLDGFVLTAIAASGAIARAGAELFFETPQPSIGVSTLRMNFYDVLIAPEPAIARQTLSVQTFRAATDVQLVLRPDPGTPEGVFSIEGEKSFTFSARRLVTVTFAPQQADPAAATLDVLTGTSVISVRLNGAGVLPSSISVRGLVNSADFSDGAAPDNWISIFGRNLAATTRSWSESDFPDGKLPTVLDGVTVTMDGKRLYLSYVSPTQINALLPATAVLAVEGVVSSSSGTGNPFYVSGQNYGAKFIGWAPGDPPYIAAVLQNGTLVGPPGLLGPKITTRPAKPGESLTVFLTGLGPAAASFVDGQLPRPEFYRRNWFSTLAI